MPRTTTSARTVRRFTRPSSRAVARPRADLHDQTDTRTRCVPRRTSMLSSAVRHAGPCRPRPPSGPRSRPESRPAAAARRPARSPAGRPGRRRSRCGRARRHVPLPVVALLVGARGEAEHVEHALRSLDLAVVNVDELRKWCRNGRPSLAMKGTAQRGGSGVWTPWLTPHPPRLDDPEAGRVPFAPTHGRGPTESGSGRGRSAHPVDRYRRVTCLRRYGGGCANALRARDHDACGLARRCGGSRPVGGGTGSSAPPPSVHGDPFAPRTHVTRPA